MKSEIEHNNKLSQYCASLRKRYVSNNKVLLIQAPQFLFESFSVEIAKNRGYYAYHPAGLQCIAKALSGRGLEIEIFDLNYSLLKHVIHEDSFDFRDWLTLLEKHLEKSQASIVGVSSINVYSDVFAPDYPLTSIMKLLRSKDRRIIIAGGPIATNEHENYLMKNLCHFVITGEGENKINFLFDYLFKNDSTHPQTEGIYFKYDDKVEQTAGQRDIVMLNGNLVNTYDLIPIEDYHNVGSLNPYSRMAGQDRRFATFQLNRGCRANCKFCGVRDFMGKGVRHYPVKDLLDEIRYLVKERGIRHFDVLDDDFLANRTLVIELLKGLVALREAYGITWSSNNGLVASSITEELMALMRDSGCVGFRIGVETGNPEMLVKMRKPATVNSLKRVGAILNKFPEVFTGGNYIIGLLGEETFGEMLETLNFSRELNLNWASFAVFQFTSKATVQSENLKTDGRAATDFVPSKGSSNREIIEEKGIVSGPEVFKLPEDTIPSPKQLRQIWFSFNLLGNYINNKNLKPNGRPEKFTSWLEAVKVAYPNNPYMSLFAGLGHVLSGNRPASRKHYHNTKTILKESQYWNYRFSQFGFNDLVADFPETPDEVYKALSSLRKYYSQWIG